MQMNIRFLKNHLLDFEVASALVAGALLRYRFDASWLVSILVSLSAFVIIPISIFLVFYMRATYFTRLARRGSDKN